MQNFDIKSTLAALLIDFQNQYIESKRMGFKPEEDSVLGFDPESVKLNSHLTLGSVGAYFSDKKGMAGGSDFAIIKYAGIELNLNGRLELPFTGTGEFFGLGCFNYELWLEDAGKALASWRDAAFVSEPYTKYFTQGPVKTICVEREVRVEVENPEHKTKAAMLDSLLARNLNIN